MAGSAKYASDELKQLCSRRAGEVLAGTAGPVGAYEELAPYIPNPIPTEAWGLWTCDGYLCAAKTADEMNAWYFHLDAAELPHYSAQVYDAEDNNGKNITVNEGDLIASFVRGESPFFFINGERFTQTGNRDPGDEYSYFMNCSGRDGRGCIVHLDKAGNGAAIYFYTSSTPVGTDERLGVEPQLPPFEATAVDARLLPSVLADYTSESTSPFWYVARE